MKNALKVLRASLDRFCEMLRAEDEDKPGENGDKRIRKQFLRGRIAGLSEAIRLLESREREKST